MKQAIPSWEKSLNILDPVSVHMLNRYIKLIKHAKTLNITECKETHHIVPKSMGGRDDLENLVDLTPRLHYIAHYMLWKAFRNRKMAFAFHIMIHGDPNRTRYTKVNSRTYDRLTTDCRELSKGVDHPMYGKKRTEESKVNQRNAVKGKKWPDERRQRMSLYWIDHYENNPKPPMPEETKQKISNALKGQPKPFTDEHKAALHVHSLNKQSITCPYCDKVGQFSNMKRWHFENCKLSPKVLEVFSE